TTYIFGTLLTANGSVKQLNIMAFSGMVINVVLNLILIPRLLAFGSAYASLATQLFTGATQLILAAIIFKFKPDFKYFIQIIVFIGVVMGLGTLSKSLSSWMHGYMLLIIVSVLFAFLLRLFNLKSLFKIIFYK
ncbi:MAG TPA: polysaccharide biosynthesis C-terminal domain-containing protein, partial [Prolixibacteraceae bacterium]|nr:polysaccharide biosynthesis C-terminal domain-containing protein [Prolixibacteraceae bacterium]